MADMYPLRASFLGLVFVAGASGLNVGPVDLLEEQRYIIFQDGPSVNNSVIRCYYDLGPREAVASIRWEVTKRGRPAGSFTWIPGSSTRAAGILRGKMNPRRDDSDLELTKLMYSLNANYTCTVTTKDGKSASATGEILVVDTTSRQFSISVHENNCRVVASVSNPFVFPRPTVQGGLYSESLGRYYQKAEYHEVKHSNRSSRFFFDQTFEIDSQTPRDVVLRSELGVTKTDGTFIRLTRHESLFFLNRGCVGLEKTGNYSVLYNHYERSCFGEYKVPFFGDLKATVTCPSGFYPIGRHRRVHLVCAEVNRTTYYWKPEHKRLMPHDLVCAEGPDPYNTASVNYSNTLLIVLVTIFVRHSMYSS